VRVNVTPRPLSTPGKDPVPVVTEAGWVPGPVWTGAENLAPTEIRSPDLPTRSQSPYRLSYPTRCKSNCNSVHPKVTKWAAVVFGFTKKTDVCWLHGSLSCVITVTHRVDTRRHYSTLRQRNRKWFGSRIYLRLSTGNVTGCVCHAFIYYLNRDCIGARACVCVRVYVCVCVRVCVRACSRAGVHRFFKYV
jgi:hypothetical protein